ncbi:MAG: glycosyltransferase, partial [Syntrophales bacterium]|nr:glycosyltransferase [Syntrophales bacterium]
MKTSAGTPETDIGRVAIVIPAYNHEGKIAGVIREARKLPWPLFVVDDGSTDSTCERIKDSPDVVVIRHDRNLGKGAAILTGFAA